MEKRADIVPTDEIVSVIDLLALPIPTFVDAAYQHLLGRSPDPGEMQKRCGGLRAGLGRLALLADLSISTEFRDRSSGVLSGQSDGAFIEDVYRKYLGRQIDPHGMDMYLRFLAQGKTRKRVVRQIANSREARTKRTFWTELEELLADERAERHWFWRWPGRHRRHERQCNRMIELTLHRAPMQAAGAALRSDLFSETFAALGPDARRILSRARQAADITVGRV